MKKFGFTLVEVLMTLGIIGVVGMLVTPSLVENGRNQANGSRLATAVSNLENAFTTAMAAQNAETLQETTLWHNNDYAGAGHDLRANAADTPIFYGQLGRFMNLNGFVEAQSMSSYYPEDGNARLGQLNANGNRGANGLPHGSNVAPDNACHIIAAKNGTTYFVGTGDASDHTAQENNIRNSGGSLINSLARVGIDVNGLEGPNLVGRDIFFFYLGENGILYPVGGNDVARFLSNGANNNNIWDSQFAQFGCRDGAIQGGFGCTARVVEEGYKINY